MIDFNLFPLHIAYICRTILLNLVRRAGKLLTPNIKADANINCFALPFYTENSLEMFHNFIVMQTSKAVATLFEHFHNIKYFYFMFLCAS